MRALGSSAGNTRGLIEARRRPRTARCACRLPRGIPAASLKRGPTESLHGIHAVSSAGNTRGLIEAWLPRESHRMPGWSSAGNTRGLIEAATGAPGRRTRTGLPRGIPAASLKHVVLHRFPFGLGASLPRGIPAASLKPRPRGLAVWRLGRLPRGIPAASLKLSQCHYAQSSTARLPRGIPAASLKPGPAQCTGAAQPRSSAGNTRGLIEARSTTRRGRCRRRSSAGNTRGLIEASPLPVRPPRGAGLPRGIPAASLKPREAVAAALEPIRSSAGNTRGLIEATRRRPAGGSGGSSSAGNTRGLIEAGFGSASADFHVAVFRGEYPRPH